MVNMYEASFFITGLYIGGFTNFFSKLIITGLFIHLTNNQIFTLERFKPLYKNINKKLKPYINYIYSYDSTERVSPRLNIVKK